jgi:hypothetical protein
MVKWKCVEQEVVVTYFNAGIIFAIHTLGNHGKPDSCEPIQITVMKKNNASGIL